MLEKKPSNRMSAGQALKHSWLKGSKPESAADVLVSKVESSLSGAVDALSSAAPVGRGDSLSEAELYSALNKEEEEQAPPSPRNMPRTVAWWQERAVCPDELLHAQGGSACDGMRRIQSHMQRFHRVCHAEATKS